LSLADRKIDSEGAPISGVRLAAAKAYAEVPGLLQKVINERDTAAWEEIANKIDYIYTHLDHSLAGLDRETGFVAEVQSQIRFGKQLLFKPNLVGPMAIEHESHGEGMGAAICTDWTVIAAHMRWFHDKLDTSYYRMALGEASASTPFFSRLLSDL
jgi:hypothetical protein